MASKNSSTYDPIPLLAGKPLTIIKVKNGKLVFKRKNVYNVLEKCGKRQLVIYSVAGDFREGKSFLLNLFLQFNHHHHIGKSWLEEDDIVRGL